MKAADLISTIIKPIQLGTSIEEALELMDSYAVSHLPVVEDSKVIGMISSEDIYTIDLKEFISEHMETGVIYRIGEMMHEFEIMKFFAETDYTTLAVVNEKDEFVGIISHLDLMSEIQTRMMRMMPFNAEGGIITLDMKRIDYHLSEIARIVESNDMKIITLYVGQPFENSPSIEVNIRVDRPDIKGLLATFERFNYNVTSTSLSNTDWQEMEDRYKAFIKYLNL
ncbi:MAG: CBS domain-containing protein [Bacteroidetes bacterium]|nr:CBS domain-containing protein [Bacteroidota bacterium]